MSFSPSIPVLECSQTQHSRARQSYTVSDQSFGATITYEICAAEHVVCGFKCTSTTHSLYCCASCDQHRPYTYNMLHTSKQPSPSTAGARDLPPSRDNHPWPVVALARRTDPRKSTTPSKKKNHSWYDHNGVHGCSTSCACQK